MTRDDVRDALEAAFRADPEVQAALGNPVRIWDAPVRQSAFPHAVWRRWETKPADSSGQPSREHIATLEIITRDTGAEAARAALQALFARANAAIPPGPAARIVLCLPLHADVLRSVQGRHVYAVLRLKIIAEPVGAT